LPPQAKRLTADFPLVDQNVNTVAPFLTLAYLYEITKESKYLAYLDAWAEWVMNDLPRYAPVSTL
jgi:rhamnogalacturonyl hydrolase YesR